MPASRRCPTGNSASDFSLYRGRRVLITGHTGFKGSWLSEWLLQLGAKVRGISLPPDTRPAIFEQLGLAKRLQHETVDIRQPEAIRKAVQTFRPEIIFHLAAQPLVRRSYERPLETYAVNVMGTAHLLEAVRRRSRPCAVVIITTDKCYENKEWAHGYRECDALGGRDPYSSSKACAELVVQAYRDSFFHDPSRRILVASARAGNVIGGGDWALDRIVPDCIRALAKGRPIQVRNRHATRPWQHVLDALYGYLLIGAHLLEGIVGPAKTDDVARRFATSFNLGPRPESNRRVEDLVEEILKHWPGRWVGRRGRQAPHEASLLHLATDKAFHLLHWQPVWDFSTTVGQTVAWYQAALRRPGGKTPAGHLQALTVRQIEAFTAAATAKPMGVAVRSEANCR